MTRPRNARLTDPEAPLFSWARWAEAAATADALEAAGFEVHMSIDHSGDGCTWGVYTPVQGSARVHADVVGARAVADLRRSMVRSWAEQH